MNVQKDRGRDRANPFLEWTLGLLSPLVFCVLVALLARWVFG